MAETKKTKQKWNSVKKELWKASPKELMEKEQELRKEIFKLEIESRSDGHLRGRQVNDKGKRFNMIKELRHRIACIKTMLTVKLKAGSR